MRNPSLSESANTPIKARVQAERGEVPYAGLMTFNYLEVQALTDQVTIQRTSINRRNCGMPTTLPATLKYG
jgi:hypothetical protein